MNVYVGLDCGGSSSRVLAVDSEGNILFQGNSGAANMASTSETRIKRNLAAATAGCPHANYVCGCFAGLVNEDLRSKAVQYLRFLFPGADIRAEPDYAAALYACQPGTDICVVAGTGSLVCSRQNGSIVKSGGRGYLLGDEGSGFQYGRDALLHYLNNPSSSTESLKAMVRELYDANTEGEIIASVYKSTTPAALLAKLSKALAADAKAGETYALKSVHAHTGQLANVVFKHVERFLPDRKSLKIGLAGGIWKAGAVFPEAFSRLICHALDPRDVEVSKITRPPLHGAVELAKEMQIGH